MNPAHLFKRKQWSIWVRLVAINNKPSLVIDWRIIQDSYEEKQEEERRDRTRMGELLKFPNKLKSRTVVEKENVKKKLAEIFQSGELLSIWVVHTRRNWKARARERARARARYCEEPEHLAVTQSSRGSHGGRNIGANVSLVLQRRNFGGTVSELQCEAEAICHWVLPPGERALQFTKPSPNSRCK